MRSPSRKDFRVYEFDSEEQVAVEKAAEKWKRNTNPSDDVSPVDKLKFLQAFTAAASVSETGRDSGADVDTCEKDCEGEEFGDVPASNALSQSEGSPVDAVQASPARSSDEQAQGELRRECVEEETVDATHSAQDGFCVSHQRPESDVLEFSFNVKKQEHGLDDDDNVTSGSSSMHSSDRSDSEVSSDQLDSANYLSISMEMDRSKVGVTISPHYVACGNKVYEDSQLTFLPDCIRIESADARGIKNPVIVEWAIETLIHIDCLWGQSVETVQVEIQSKPTNPTETDSKIDFCDTVSLVFTVFGPHWLRQEKEIMSLDPKYKDLWKVGAIVRKAIYPDDSGELNLSFTTHYLADYQRTLEDVVYPRGDPDAVSINQRDVELLQPETFINDTIIDFYIKYLKNKMKPEETNRFHFFNSFFFRKLADLDKDPQSRMGGRAAFMRVRKWTRKVNIFEKDYIYIPVNFNLHWSLLVICHPGEIADLGEKDIVNCPRVPCILHMDSMQGSHNGLKSLMQSYLWEEWKERHPECHENTDTSAKFLNLRFISLELPQQENMFDCGLFLLHYVELFLKEAPVNFSPFRITNISNFLSMDWFVPAEASFKRFLIRKLLHDLFCNMGQNEPISSKDEHYISQHIVNKNDPAQLLSDRCYRNAIGLSAKPIVDQGSELRLLASSFSDGQNDDSRLAGSCLDLYNFPFQSLAISKKRSCPMSPIEEDVGQFGDLNAEKDGPRPANGISTYETCSTSYSLLDFGAVDTSNNLKSSIKLEHSDSDSVSECPSSSSQSSSEQCISKGNSNDHRYLSDHTDDVMSIENEMDGQRSVLVGDSRDSHSEDGMKAGSREMLDTCTVQDSQEDWTVDTSNEVERQKYITQDNNVQQITNASFSECSLPACINKEPQGTNVNEEAKSPPFVAEGKYVNDSQSPRGLASEEIETSMVKDSEEVEVKSESDNSNDLLNCKVLGLPCQDIKPTREVVSLDDGDSQTDSDDLAVVSQYQPSKRRKVRPSVSRRIRTRSLSSKSSL